MKPRLSSIWKYIWSHKVLSAIALIIIVLVGRGVYKKATSTSGDTRYVTAEVARGSVIASISGTGQVSASNQVDVKPKASGDITYVAVKAGQAVKAGALIASIDATDAQKSVRDAEASLEDAKLSLQKAQLQNSETTVNAGVDKDYASALAAVTNAFLDLPNTMNGLNDMLESRDLSDNTVATYGQTASGYLNAAETSYYAAKKAYDAARVGFQALNSNSARGDIENAVNETYETEKLVADALNDFNALVNYLSEHADQSSAYDSDQQSLISYTNSTSSHLSALLSSQTTIQDDKTAQPSADLSLQSAELSVQERENALQDAKDKLADYSVRAPFDGVIASVDAKVGDAASSGAALATLVTNDQIAELSLNEVDVAKVSVGQKATLTFDAVPDLTITGSVAEIDQIGTVSQGVVNYDVKINFDTQDDRVKPSMSFSAEIITDSRQDVLTVPNGAVKTANGASYVEVFDPPLAAAADSQAGTISLTPPERVPVEVGLSNDTDTEIVSGLTEGEQVVARTVAPSTTAATAAPSLIGGNARATGGGNATFRAGGTGGFAR